MSRVALLRGVEPVETTRKALQLIGADVKKILEEKKPILIKPNYINMQHPSTGITTDSRVIEGIIRFIRSQSTEEIIIGEGCGFGDTLQAFKVAGVDEVAEKYNVELVDFNNDTFVEVHPANPFSLKTIRVAKTAVESTIISVPKLKPHRIATVTLSLKNMMGTLASKGSMHRGRLNKNIVDLASAVRPSLSVVDGVIAGEGHETRGSPVQMDTVIAGTDPVAVDAVGASLMGIPPTDVKHLVLAEQKGLGTCNLDEIKVLGSPIEEVKRKFHRSFSSKLLSHIG